MDANKNSNDNAIRSIVIISIVFSFFIVLGSLLSDSKTLISSPSYIDKAVSCIKDGKYNDATVALVMKKDSDKTASVLYNYANAKEEEISDISMNHHYLQKIPDSYKGELADEIKTYKVAMQSKYDEYKKNENIKNAAIKKANDEERAKHLYIGDPENKIVKIYGKPNRINKTVIGNDYESKQYCYNNMYIYTENGFVTAYQN